MEGLKFEHEGTTYNVPCMPNKYWREALLYYGDCPARLVACQDSMCYCCIYHRGNQKARKAFYYECFPEEKPCEECANCYKVLSSAALLILEKQVNEHLQRGWVLQGGVVKDGDIYMQAMVKK